MLAIPFSLGAEVITGVLLLESCVCLTISGGASCFRSTGVLTTPFSSSVGVTTGALLPESCVCLTISGGAS